MGRIMERIPHKTVAYAYLEIEAENSNAFEALREETLKNRPNYAFALGQPAEPKNVEVPAGDEASNSGDESGDASAAPPPPPAPAATSTPTSTEGLSPREIARQRMAQKGSQ